MFTRRHYNAVAAALRTNHYKLYSTAWLTYEQADKVHTEYVNRLADLFAADNPRFKRSLFERAATSLPER